MKKNYLNKNIKKNQGYSLIEILIVFVIIGVALAGAFALYSKNADTTNAKTMASDLQAVSSGVRSAWAQDENLFATVETKKACQLGILTSNMVWSNCANGMVYNKYNGWVTIAAGNTSYPPANFTIDEEKVPPAVIVKTINQMGIDGVLGITVNGICVYSSGTIGSDDADGCSNQTAQGFSAAELSRAVGTAPGSFKISYGM